MSTVMKAKPHRCEVEELFKLIGGRWKVLLLRELSGAPVRHGRLLRDLKGISQKMLTQRLRELEAAGIVGRNVFAEGRVNVVEYSLSDWGHEVMRIVSQMHDWVVANRHRL